MTRRTRAVLAGGAALLLSGCSEYLDRRDTLLLGAGDAVETNLATHRIDPWPRASGRLFVATDGERAQRAIERYRNPQSGLAPGGSPAPTATLGTSSGTVPATR